MYWYVYGAIKSGKKAGTSVVLGPINDENEAADRCLGLLHPHKIQLDTRDQHRAMLEIRTRMKDNGASYSDVLSRHARKMPDDSKRNININENEVIF